MAADDHHAGFSGHRSPPFQYASQQLQRELLDRPRDEVESGGRCPPHRVNVGHRVGRGDAPPVEGVVDDGREEVDRLHQAQPVGQEVDGGVVTGRRGDQHLGGIFGWGQEAQDLGQVARGELARSTGAMAEPGEPHLLPHRLCHADHPSRAGSIDPRTAMRGRSRAPA